MPDQILQLPSCSFSVSPTNNQLGSKFLTKYNALAYSHKASITLRKSFISSDAVQVKYNGNISHSFTITFTDPSKYEGPIVEGWGPNISRNVKPFLRPGTNVIKHFTVVIYESLLN